MDVTITQTEDIRGWGDVTVPSSDGVLHPAGAGVWVVDHADGRRQVWRSFIVPGTTHP